MAGRSLRAALARSRALRVGWQSVPDPVVAEAQMLAGCEAVFIDLQHGMIDTAAAFALIGAIRARGGYAMARVPVGEFQTASRLLDWGADLVVAPMIETVAEAEAFAAFAKYPVLGQRSWGPTRALQLSGLDAETYRTTANHETLALVMIETARALEAIDAILAVPGIDGVYLGPFDLSVSLSPDGTPGIDRPDTLAAIAHVAERTRAAGKVSGIYGSTPAHVRRYYEMGYTFSTLSNDLQLLTAGFKAFISEVEA